MFDYSINVEELKICFGKDNRKIELSMNKIDQNDGRFSAIAELLKQAEIYIEICIGKGPYSEKVWGCDLTEGYIKTNAYYAT